jgi:hypothetical protein
MTVFTEVEASGKLKEVLQRAAADGGVFIKREDGQEFLVKPIRTSRSPLDVGYVDLRPTADEIIEAVRAGRDRRIP